MSKSHLRFLLAGVLAAAVSRRHGGGRQRRYGRPDPVIQWNQALIGILNTPGAQPATIHATRSLAILQPRSTTRSTRSSTRTRRTSSRFARQAAPTRARRRRPPATRCSPASTRASRRRSARNSPRCSPQVPNGYHKYEGVRTGEAVADALAGPSRRRRLRRNAACVHPDRAARAATSRRRRRSPSRCSRSGRSSGRSCSGLRSQFRPAPPPALDEQGLHRGLRRGEEPRQRDQHDPHARPDRRSRSSGTRRSGSRGTRSPRPAALAHHDTLMQDARLFAAAQPELRRLGDRLLRRQVHLRLLAARDGGRGTPTATERRPTTRTGRRS